MTTYTLDGPGTTNATTRRGQSDTYNLTHGHTLNLKNNGGTATITTNLGMMGGDSDNFVLTEHGGTTAINLMGQSGPLFGTMFLYDGASVTETGWSHSRWQNTGASVINNSTAVFVTPIVGGSISIEHGGSLTGGFINSAVTLRGGTLIQEGWWGSPFASDVTLDRQTPSHPDRIILDHATGGTSYDIKGDLLTVHNAAGATIGTANVHNHTNAPIQVDQLATGVAIIANAVPQPGMLVGHVVV